MKNWIKSMFVMLCGMMISATFIACGGDDDDNGGGNGEVSADINGTWCMFRANVEGDVSDANVYTFNNGTLKAERYEYYGSQWELESSHTYKYSLSGNRIYIEQFGWMGDADGTYTIKGNTLTLIISQQTIRFEKVDLNVMDYLNNLIKDI